MKDVKMEEVRCSQLLGCVQFERPLFDEGVSELVLLQPGPAQDLAHPPPQNQQQPDHATTSAPTTRN